MGGYREYRRTTIEEAVREGHREAGRIALVARGPGAAPTPGEIAVCVRAALEACRAIAITVYTPPAA